MWCCDSSSCIQKRSYKKSYIFFCQYRSVQSTGKSLKKWMMRLLGLKYSSTNNCTIFILHGHTVSNSTERNNINIFLKYSFCFFWKEKIRQSMDHLPDNPRTRQCRKGIERISPTRIHNSNTIRENIWTRMMICDDDIHTKSLGVFYRLSILCPAVDSDDEFCACLSYLIHMIRFDTIAIMNTMWESIRYVNA